MKKLIDVPLQQRVIGVGMRHTSLHNHRRISPVDRADNFTNAAAVAAMALIVCIIGVFLWLT